MNKITPPQLTDETQKPQEFVARKDTSFRGDIIRLLSGTGAAQLIGILAAPVVARLYPPEAYGVAAIFAALVNLFGVVACMRYELSITLPEDDQDAANLLGVSLCFSGIVALCSVLVVILAGVQVLEWANMAQLMPFLWLLPLAIFVHGVFTALNYWNTRTKHFTRLAIARVMSQATTTSAFLAAGFAGHATGAVMITAGVGGQAVATGVLGSQIWRADRQFLVRNIRWRQMLAGLKRYKAFAIYGSWSGLLNTVSWLLPVFLLGSFFSPIVVGYYALGFRVLQVPMSLVGGSISKVFFQRAAQAKLDGTLAPLVEGLFERLAVISFLPMALLTFVGSDLYAVVFGSDWAEAGAYVQILALWAFVWFVSSPLSQLFSVLEKQKFGLKWNLVLLSTRVVSLILGGLIGDVHLALFLFAATGIGVYGFFCMRLMRAAGVAQSQLTRIIRRTIIYSLPFCVGTGVCSILGVQGWGIVCIAALSMILYFAMLWKLRPELMK